MKRLTLCAAALALWPGAAAADPIRWGYDWTAFPGEVPAGASRVRLSDEPYHTAVGTSSIVAANLNVISTADAARPDVLGPKAGFYALALGLQDLASGQWGAVLFQGQLQGRLWGGGSVLTNRLIGPTSQTLVLGNTEFTVSYDSFAAPSGPGAVNAGSLGFTVAASPAPTVGLPVPEPSALVLAGVGLSAVALAARRRARGAEKS